MLTSREKRVNVEHSHKNCAPADKRIGLCKNCGHKISLCWRNFTASIECSKCNYINEFLNSQQPVSVHQKNSSADMGAH